MVTKITELCDAKSAWYSLSTTRFYGLEHGLGILSFRCSNAQRISAPNTTILTNIVCTFDGLTYFGRMIYA